MTAPHNAENMTCEDFQRKLPELIGAGEDINLHPHIESCDLCRALLADLEAIADAARQLFPTVEPPDELWSEIEDRIKKEKPGVEHDDPNPGQMAAAAGGSEPSTA